MSIDLGNLGTTRQTWQIFISYSSAVFLTSRGAPLYDEIDHSKDTRIPISIYCAPPHVLEMVSRGTNVLESDDRAYDV